MNYLLWLAFIYAAGRAYQTVLRRIYPAEELCSQVLFADCEDGWRLPLYRHSPRGEKRRRRPVLICHGFTGNRRNLDYGDEHSMARFLSGRGYDCFVIELRGGPGARLRIGASARRRRFTFDDFVFGDAPAAIAAILRETGADKIHWVGHSMGGMIAYARMGVDQAPFCSAALLGSPAYFDGMADNYRLLLALKPLLQLYPTAVSGSFLRPLVPLMGRGVDFFLDQQTDRENIDPAFLRGAIFNSVSDTSMGVALQMAGFLAENEFKSNDGLDFREGMKKAAIPSLVFAGASDRVAPAGNVRRSFELLGSPEKQFRLLSKKEGCAHNYGHMDMIFGNNSVKEVFEPAAAWLDAADERP